jgi:hypothetical protein
MDRFIPLRSGSRRSALGRAFVALSVAAAFVPAAAAQAATSDGTDASATFTDGGLNVVAPADVSFGSNQLTGSAATVTANLGNWSVNDATGDAAGWVVSGSASTPTDGTNTLPTAVISMVSPTAISCSGTNPALPSGSLTLTGGASIITAESAEGVGSCPITQGGTSDISLAVPHDAKPTSYSSTVTYTIAPPA